MQPDFWNDKRPAGVPLDIDMTAFTSVVDVFERSCKKFADRPAFSNLGVTLTYAELERRLPGICSSTPTSSQVTALRCKCPISCNTPSRYSVRYVPG